MGLFDLVFDELGKEIKEAPGWLSLAFACNLLLFLPGVKSDMERLGMEGDKTTIATLIALALFFLGDVLDTFIFPREGHENRGEKLLKSSMLVLGAFAVFSFLSMAYLRAAGLSLLWIVIIPIYDSRQKRVSPGLKSSIDAATPPKQVIEVKHSSDEETGFKRVVLQYDRLTRSKNAVQEKLGIRNGIYKVSKALARKTERYTISIWLPNEAAKFIRSTVFPTLAAGVWLAIEQKQWSAGLLILASPALLILYCWLKGLHIRKLYDLAMELVEADGQYRSLSPYSEVKLFLWGTDIIDCVKISREV